jgi:protoporphyrinogen oxidase
MRPSIAVIGGGMTGLTLALRLQDQGATVTVFDQAPEFGGLSAAAQFPGFTWDRFYHVIAGGDLELQALLRELGLEPMLQWSTVTQGIWLDNAVRPLVGPLDLLRLPGMSLLDKLRLGWFALRGHHHLPAAGLDTATSLDWVRERCGKRAAARFWEPLLRAKLGSAAERASARFLHATFARLQRARQGSNKERFGCVRGGYRTILDALVLRLRERNAVLFADTKVMNVRTTSSGVAVESARGSMSFDRAVVTLPNAPLANVVQDLPPATAAALRATTYLGAVVTAVAGRTPLSGHYILNLCDPRLSITGILEMTAVVDRSQTAGSTLVYLPRYEVADSPVFAEPDEVLAQQALADLHRVFPETMRNWQLGHVVHRARLIQPIPLAGVRAAVPPSEVIPGRVYCVTNAQLPGGALNNNDCVALATRAAPAIAAAMAAKTADTAHASQLTAQSAGAQ